MVEDYPRKILRETSSGRGWRGRDVVRAGMVRGRCTWVGHRIRGLRWCGGGTRSTAAGSTPSTALLVTSLSMIPVRFDDCDLPKLRLAGGDTP